MYKTSFVNPEPCRKKHLQILSYFKIQTNRQLLNIWFKRNPYIFLIFFLFFFTFRKMNVMFRIKNDFVTTFHITLKKFLGNC